MTTCPGEIFCELCESKCPQWNPWGGIPLDNSAGLQGGHRSTNLWGNLWGLPALTECYREVHRLV